MCKQKWVLFTHQSSFSKSEVHVALMELYRAKDNSSEMNILKFKSSTVLGKELTFLKYAFSQNFKEDIVTGLKLSTVQYF